MNVASAPSIDDLWVLAKRRLPRVCSDFIDGGAEGEVTLRANREAFEQLAFRPHYLVDVASRDQSTIICGTPVSLPVLLAPTGLTRVASRNAEVDAARAAGAAGTVYCVSSMASTTVEEIARAASGPLWFQLYLWGQPEVWQGLLRRARDCNCQALVVTVDVPVSSRRLRDWRNGFALPLKLSVANRLEALRHPAWIHGYLTGPSITFANLAELVSQSDAAVLGKMVNEELCNPAANWDDLRRLRDSWKGQLLVKGTLTPEDAEAAVACGADGIIVSNHGGRQLDCAQPTIDVLPEIAAAVGGKVDVMLDSGIRRGSDVVKAIALGAKAVMIGRPYLWGLAAGGERGAARAIEILRSEIDICLTLLGRRSLADLDPSLIHRRRPGEQRPVVERP